MRRVKEPCFTINHKKRAEEKNDGITPDSTRLGSYVTREKDNNNNTDSADQYVLYRRMCLQA